MPTHAALLTAYARAAVNNLLDDVPDRAGPPPLSSRAQCDAHAQVIDDHAGALIALAASRHLAGCQLDPDVEDPRDALDLIGMDDPCADVVDDVVYSLNLT